MKYVTVIIALPLLFFSGSSVFADGTAHKVKDQKHCVTGKTKSSGARRSCYQNLAIEAPNGFAFDPDSIKLHTLYNAGTGFGCASLRMHREKVSRTREAITSVTAQANARSPKGGGLAVVIVGTNAGSIIGAVVAPEVARHAKGTGSVACLLEGTYYKD